MSKNKITRAKVENYFDETLMGPKGLLSMAFSHKVKVPTMKEAKEERAQYKKEPQSNYTKKGRSLLDKAFKAIKKRKTLEGAMNEIVKQMQKLSSSIDKNNEKKVADYFLAYAERRVNKSGSPARGGGGTRRRGNSSRVMRGGAGDDDGGGDDSAITGAPPPPAGIGAAQQSLANLHREQDRAVREGRLDAALQLQQLINAANIGIHGNQHLGNLVRQRRWRAWAPYIAMAAGIALAAFGAYHLVMGVENFAAAFAAGGLGIINMVLATLIEIVMRLVSANKWLWTPPRGVDVMDDVWEQFFEFAAEAGGFDAVLMHAQEGGQSLKFVVMLILFIIFLVLEALAWQVWQADDIRLGWGAIHVRRQPPPALDNLPGFSVPTQTPVVAATPQALTGAPPQPQLTNTPHHTAAALAAAAHAEGFAAGQAAAAAAAAGPADDDDDDDEGEGHVETVEQDGGSRRRRRRRTKKRGRGRKGRSRKRSRKKKRRRSSHKRKRGSRRRRRSRRVSH